jgi:quercetin dioxygenase-like cupin family protein
MKHIRLGELRHAGSSHHFVGRDHDVAISSFLFNGMKGSGPGPHRHPYDEIQFIMSGRARYKVDGKEMDAGGGEILVIKAGEVHEFKVISDEPLVQVDVHMSEKFIQENL